MSVKRKILFAGLDNCGKSSFISTIQKKFTYGSTKPTMGLDRKDLMSTRCFGMEFVVWDLGGQTRFRSNYFENKYRYFSHVSVMFYLIDIKDPARFDEALEYLGMILNVLKEIDERPRIVICFHKFDPDLYMDSSVNGRVSDLRNDILSCFSAFGDLFSFLFRNTSIHDLSSILRAFSEGVFRDLPKQEIIVRALREYARSTFSSAVVLLDENSLIIGSHSTRAEYIEICESISPRFILAMERIMNYSVTLENVIVQLSYVDLKDFASSHVSHMEKNVSLFIRSFEIQNGLRFFVVSLSLNKNSLKLSNDRLPILADQLTEILEATEL